jgi:hypothetical protein
MSDRDSRPSTEQMRYAGVLDYGMKAGLAVLAVTFVAYVTGALPVQVSFDALPRLWSLSAADYLSESGMPGGWGWVALLAKGDVLALTGIAFLSAVSLPCLVLLVPTYASGRDWAYLGITLALIGVLVLAASGVLGAH